MMGRWQHPGGKLRELGPDSLTDGELLAILISSGIKGKPAQEIADEILEKYGTLESLSDLTLENFRKIKGLSNVKSIRIVSAFELARRLGGRAKGSRC